MTKTEKDLAKAIQEANQSAARHDAKIATLRAKLGDRCTHSRTEDFDWEHDDGYGRQSWNKGRRCILCGAKNHWPSMSAHWSRETYRSGVYE